MSVTISANDVKKLREQTGAGVMDCKKALEETNGDFEGAIEYLRKKGQKLADKRADRNAKEGVAIALVNDAQDLGVVLTLNCETDFVAKNETFINLAKSFAEAALANNIRTKEDLLNCAYEGITIGEKIAEQTGVIGEKLEIGTYEALNAPLVVAYIHMGYRSGVILGMSKAGDFVAAGRDAAMQVAAMRPIAVDKADVDTSIVEKEIEIGKELARNEGKPEAMLEKIALGRLNKFYQEKTLLNQEFVKDNSKTVRVYLQGFDKDLTVTGFKHLAIS